MEKLIVTSKMCKPCHELILAYPDVRAEDITSLPFLNYVIHWLFESNDVATPITIVAVMGNGEEARRLLEL